ncbi:LysM peptidoglycan-binding domain-containing protein [Thermodesulfobacteriota bacterium]
MKHAGACCVAYLLTLIFFENIFTPFPAEGAFLYKKYVVRQVRGQDILCDPYRVKKDDYVLKIFRQKGEIAHDDFPEFLNIFQRINPHIHDINRIRPNQQIFIPLKKLRPGSMPGQSSGVVTIPFVTISNIDEIRATHTQTYQVQKRDCVSVIIARHFGPYGSKNYREGIELFKIFNPNITDLDLIYVGQKLHIPDTSVRNQPWYPSLLAGLPVSQKSAAPKDSLTGEILPSESTPAPDDPLVSGTPISKAASALNAKLLNKGTYYFPQKGGRDFKLDLSRFPILEVGDSTLILAPHDHKIDETDLDVMKTFWPNLEVVSIPSEGSAEQVIDSVFRAIEKDYEGNELSFSDQGVRVNIHAKWITKQTPKADKTARHICITPIDNWNERTPDAIRYYLEQKNIFIRDIFKKSKTGKKESSKRKPEYMAREVLSIGLSSRRSFVKDLLRAVGCSYSPNVHIMFPYAGIEVQAVSNLVSTREGRELLIDFGDFYGDALSSIEKTGLEIIQIKEKDSMEDIVLKLFEEIGISYTKDPTVSIAERTGNYNTTLTIPGFLIANGNSSKKLIAAVPLHDRVIQFFQENDTQIIMIGPTGKTS